MKVVCEYCGSYVEADENMKCPLCNAGLGSSVKAEEERIEQKDQEEQQREAEEKAQEAKDTHVSEIIKGIAGVATAFVASGALSNASSESDDETDRRPPEHDGWRPPEHDGRHMNDGERIHPGVHPGAHEAMQMQPDMRNRSSHRAPGMSGHPGRR